MKYLDQLLRAMNGFVWGVPALVLILGVGICFSMKTGFAQLTLFPKAVKNFFAKLRVSKDGDGVSSYQTLCTALSATVGTGNIAGVAGAIAIGGPGAVFWMWICAVFGMITKLAEATLAVHFQRRSSDGQTIGGPMYMIERGMGQKFRWLACLYALFGVAAAFGVGNATQVNAVLDGFNSVLLAFGGQKSKWTNLLLSTVLAVLAAVCLLGGARRIGRVTERLVPFSACGYILLGLSVIYICRDRIPSAFHQIVLGAFSPGAVTGGVVGSVFQALRTGVSRGVFTNEAGMGTASISYASACVGHPVEQGLMGVMEVFIDTVVICTITALAILCSGAGICYGVDEGAMLTSRAFASVLGSWVHVPIALFLACFAFATMLGWGLYGARCAQYLFGAGCWKYFVALQALVVSLSSVLETGTIWLLAEIMNGLMAIPNLVALLALSPVLFGLVEKYKTNDGISCVSGGTYESFDQCKPLRALSYEKVSSSCGGGGEKRKKDLSSEYRSARFGDT